MKSHDSIKSNAVLYTVLTIFGLVLLGELTIVFGQVVPLSILGVAVVGCVVMIIYECIYDFLNYRNSKDG